MKRPKLFLIFLMIIAFILGYLFRGPRVTDRELLRGRAGYEKKETTIWTCSMHPQIKLPKPGRCPICGMDLIPVKASGVEGDQILTMSEEAKKLAEIQTSPVERKFVTADIRLVGKVDYDETRVRYITAWVPGRLDRLYVDYTGVPVKKGDHMVYMYSPEIVSAQEELIQAKRAVREIRGSGIDIMRETTLSTLEAAREKLRLWGLTDDQIDAIEKKGVASDRITLYAPISGIVIDKDAVQGMYVDTGTRIYTVADLSQLWIRLDAYESDMMWIRYGQNVEFTTEAYPGEVFQGKISFIDPVLNEKTRTIKVRVNAENQEGKLKPGMFVRAVVKARVAAAGRVMEPDLAGKWICPMHPDVIKAGPGTCDICGMPLVTTESLGYVSVDKKASAPLVIPASAALITGKRAIVYVEVPGAEGPTFEGREIVLGPRAGDYYIVRSGLKEGERVVTRGNFKIDSAMQIEAKSSMMSPEGGAAHPGHHHGEERESQLHVEKQKFELPTAFRLELKKLVEAYTAIQSPLADDNKDGAKAAAGKMSAVLNKMSASSLKGTAQTSWNKEASQTKEVLEKIASAKDIQGQREGFALLSEIISGVVKRFGPIEGLDIYQVKCPMAFKGRGATWFQEGKKIRNPYFGKTMLRCGVLIK